MSLSDSLPPLPNLAGDSQSPASGGNTSRPVTAGRILTAIATGGASETVPGFSLQSIVAIILGLLFIAAGIFAFKEVRQTIVTTGKQAVKVAAVA